MISRLPIRIALQGGGAKLMPMLAVAEAIQHLRNKQEIEIRGIAGTSAGAIVAAILALDINPRDFANRLSEKGDIYIERISGKYDKFTIVKITKILRATFFSKPYSSTDELRKILLEVFTNVSPEFSQETTMSEVKKYIKSDNPLKIVVSDLHRSKKSVISSEENAGESLLDAIVHSCALPIFFRNRAALSASPLVDGGLYNNFPTEEICEDPNSNIIGITFSQPSAIPKLNNGLSYLLHLLLSTIDQSVRKSRDLVSPDDLISIETDISTLDFDKALAAKPGTSTYENVKSVALSDLRKYVRRKNSRTRTRTINELIRDNQRIFENHHLNVKKRQIFLGLAITFSDLAKEGEPKHSRYSEQTLKSRFSAINEPIYAVSLGSFEPLDSSPLTGFCIRVLDDKKNELGFTQVPGFNTVQVEKENHDFISTLIYFDSPVLPPGEGGSEVEVSKTDHIIEAGNRLYKNGEAVLSLRNVTNIPYEEAALLIHIPIEISTVFAKSNNERNFTEMTTSEINSFSPTPAGFKSYGWKTASLNRKSDFSLTLMLRQ